MFACFLVADKAKFSSELFKFMQTEQVNSESDGSGDAWLRDTIHLKPKPIVISVLFYKLRSFNNY